MSKFDRTVVSDSIIGNAKAKVGKFVKDHDFEVAIGILILAIALVWIGC